MNKLDFLNAKETEVANKLLATITGAGTANITSLDVESICAGYKHIVSAASIRHHAIQDVQHLKGPLTLQGDPVIARERAMEDLGIQERTAELAAEFENERRDPGNDPEPTAAVQ